MGFVYPITSTGMLCYCLLSLTFIFIFGCIFPGIPPMTNLIIQCTWPGCLSLRKQDTAALHVVVFVSDTNHKNRPCVHNVPVLHDVIVCPV